MKHEVCVVISTLDAKRRRREVVRPVWLNKRQMERLLLLYYNPDSPWTTDTKTLRELKAKRLVSKEHRGDRDYRVVLTEDGGMLAKYLVEAAMQKAKKSA